LPSGRANPVTFLSISFACPKEMDERKGQPRVFDDPLSARFLSQPSRSFRLSKTIHIYPNKIRNSLLRLAFDGIFAEWVPRRKPEGGR